MRPLAFLQLDRQQTDTIIVWDDGERLVAFSYLDGQVVGSRPFEAAALDEQAEQELEAAFGVPAAGMVRIRQAAEPQRWR